MPWTSREIFGGAPFSALDRPLPLSSGDVASSLALEQLYRLRAVMGRMAEAREQWLV
jgi:hypothetical protein